MSIPRYRGPRRALGLFLLPLLLGGCALFFRNPVVEIVEVRLVSLGFTSGTAEVVLELENPNFFSLEVREFDYLLEVENGDGGWARLARGDTREITKLPRRSTERVALEVPFDYEALSTALQSWWSTGEVSYRIEGAVTARGLGSQREFPFQARGQMAP